MRLWATVHPRGKKTIYIYTPIYIHIHKHGRLLGEVWNRSGVRPWLIIRYTSPWSSANRTSKSWAICGTRTHHLWWRRWSGCYAWSTNFYPRVIVSSDWSSWDTVGFGSNAWMRVTIFHNNQSWNHYNNHNTILENYEPIMNQYQYFIILEPIFISAPFNIFNIFNSFHSESHRPIPAHPGPARRPSSQPWPPLHPGWAWPFPEETVWSGSRSSG